MAIFGRILLSINVPFVSCLKILGQVHTSVGSNPKITNFELLQTLSKPRFVNQNRTKNPPEPYKSPELQTHESNYNKHFRENLKLLWTLEVELQTLPNPGLPTKTELRTHQKFRTSNSRTGFDPTLVQTTFLLLS